MNDTRPISTLSEIVLPPSKNRLTNEQLLLGPRHDAKKIITTYSADDWEEMILEWACSLKTRYQEVRRAGGAGDMGRDVVAYEGAVNDEGPWDNFQCKHYKSALAPSDVWGEIAKVCFYTFNKHYTVPRQYSFVAPHGCGTKLQRLLEKPDKLKQELTEVWSKGELLEVSGKQVKLENRLLNYVDAFNFRIFRELPVHDLIEQHRSTRYHAPRFGGGLVKQPPHDVEPPAEIASIETRYVQQLFEAYSDRLKRQDQSVGDLPEPKVVGHFLRQRTHFYLAEELRNFTRDNLPEEGCFERLQTEIRDGVIDVAERSHSDGVERLTRTIEAARNLQIDSHPLKGCLHNNHRSGICHQLANEDELTWVPK